MRQRPLISHHFQIDHNLPLTPAPWVIETTEERKWTELLGKWEADLNVNGRAVHALPIESITPFYCPVQSKSGCVSLGVCRLYR